MKDKIVQFVNRKPLLSGLIGGFLLYLLLSGLIQVLPFGTAETPFKNAAPVLKEDYLRLAVRDYAVDSDPDRAAWRFSQLGGDGDRLLLLLKKDALTDPAALLRFSDAVTENGFPVAAKQLPNAAEQSPQNATAPLEAGGAGIPPVGIVFIVLIILILLCLLFLYFFSEHGKDLRSRIAHFAGGDFRSLLSNLGRMPKFGRKTDGRGPRWSVREDDDFDLGVIINRFPEEDLPSVDNDQNDETDALHRETTSLIEDEFEDEFGDRQAANALDSNSDLPWDETDDPDEAEDLMNADAAEETEDLMNAGVAEETEDDAFELPDSDEADDEDEIHFLKTSVSELDLPDAVDDDSEIPEPVRRQTSNAPLVHFQTAYQLGDDLFDETFSLDDEDELFLGECGIGIAETINSTDPKAVTAFEIWLFDREDVQTPTFFLLSDFAYSNESLLNRLKNKGRFDRLVKGGEYIVESHTLKMKVQISALEYGTENDERNSYFNQVAFDVTVWQK